MYLYYLAEDYMPDTHQMHKMDTNEQPYQIQAIPTIQVYFYKMIIFI